MNEEGQSNQGQASNEQPVFQPQASPNQTFTPPQPVSEPSKRRVVGIILAVVIVLLLVGVAVLYVIQSSRASAYLTKVKEFGSSTGVSQLEGAFTEFNSDQGGLYKDMYYCKADSTRMFSPIERKGLSQDANSAAFNVLKEYREAYDYMTQNTPGEYKTLPLVGGIGKSAEAKKASQQVGDFIDLAGQLGTSNDYSQYCLNELYGMLAGQLTYLEQFASEAKLAEAVKTNSAYVQEKIDGLTQYKSYGTISLDGFEKVGELRGQFIDGVLVNLTGLRTSEQTARTGTSLALGTAYSGFAQNIAFFDDAIVPEASQQAEKFIGFDTAELQIAFDNVKRLAN